VELARLPADRLRLEVSDRGVGLPPGFDPAKPGDSLGMRIATGLAHQLGGGLDVVGNNPGARFGIVINLAG
jgi:two-component sensor histidine kinase